eukprot:2560020-Lingulodinium_polyedra.AAC.1
MDATLDRNKSLFRPDTFQEQTSGVKRVSAKTEADGTTTISAPKVGTPERLTSCPASKAATWLVGQGK